MSWRDEPSVWVCVCHSVLCDLGGRRIVCAAEWQDAPTEETVCLFIGPGTTCAAISSRRRSSACPTTSAVTTPTSTAQTAVWLPAPVDSLFGIWDHWYVKVLPSKPSACLSIRLHRLSPQLITQPVSDQAADGLAHNFLIGFERQLWLLMPNDSKTIEPPFVERKQQVGQKTHFYVFSTHRKYVLLSPHCPCLVLDVIPLDPGSLT